MKSKVITTILLTVVIMITSVGSIAVYAQYNYRNNPTPVSVYFSPKGGCTEQIVSVLGRADKTVLVQAYSFTSDAIAEALVAAHRRGVQVRVILDKGQKTEKFSLADSLIHDGIPVFVDRVHAIAHNKIIIIDNQIVITGSFNFTKSAEEHNAENLLILHNSELAKAYTENWEKHLAHSQGWKP